MAKKIIPLTARDIILQADAETIREALEARVQIDDLLAKREEAYRQIEALEQQVEALVGEEGVFVYPEPPVPVAGFANPTPASRPKPTPPKVEKPVKEKAEEKAGDEKEPADGETTEAETAEKK